MKKLVVGLVAACWMAMGCGPGDANSGVLDEGSQAVLPDSTVAVDGHVEVGCPCANGGQGTPSCNDHLNGVDVDLDVDLDVEADLDVDGEQGGGCNSGCGTSNERTHLRLKVVVKADVEADDLVCDPGAKLSVKAWAELETGEWVDVSDLAVWSTSDLSLATCDGGELLALASGKVKVTARLGDLEASADIRIRAEVDLDLDRDVDVDVEL